MSASIPYRTFAAPHAVARAAGALYVLEGMASLFGQMLIPRLLVVPGDPRATAAAIAGNEILFRLSLLLGLVAVICHTVQTVFLYELFRPAGRTAARTFAFVSLVMLSLQAGTCLLQIPAMVAHDLARGVAARPESLESLALVFMVARARAFNTYLAFFGLKCGLVGLLILRSTFMPRVIGPLMALAGLGYLVYLWPGLASRLQPVNLALAAPGELSLMAWLLVVGVNAERWRAQAAAPDTGASPDSGGRLGRGPTSA